MNKKTDIHAKEGSAAAQLLYKSVLQIINVNGNSLTEEDIKRHETQYLKRVIADCKGLEWLSLMGKEDSNESTIGLDSIYTALLTDSLEEQKGGDESRQEVNVFKKLSALRDKYKNKLSALEVLNRYPHLVLTGDPGSGKSAFVNYLSICLAGEQLGNHKINLQALTEPLPDKKGNPQTIEVETENKETIEQKVKQEVRQNWHHQALIPVRVILRDFAASAYFPDKDEKSDTRQIMDFIQDDLKDKDGDAYFEILRARLQAGEALLMFDGLDEVPQAGDRRKRLVACIEGFAKSYSDTRIRVTCRPYAYQNTQWQLHGFNETKLAKFHRGQIIRFIKQWYKNAPEFDKETAQNRSDKLIREIFKASSVTELAERPLLLSLIAYLHAKRHELPERKADLYEKLLELLINEWEKVRFKTEDADSARNCHQYSLAEFLDIGQDTIRLVLERLAFEGHANQNPNQNETADISAKDLTHYLYSAAKNVGKEVKISQLYEYLRDRVGILYQRGGKNEENAIYTFPHRSFQEYLAASYFRREEDALFDHFENKIEIEEETWQELAATLGRTDSDKWREVIILLGGIKSQKEPGPVWDLLDALSQDIEGLDEPKTKGLRLAAEILAENLKHDNLNRKQQRIFKKIQNALPQTLKSDYLPAVERAAIGRYLGVIGDPRAEVMTVDAMPFCFVPAGEFYMGEDKDGFEYDINHDYWIAKNTTTVAQFFEFVASTEYSASEKLKDQIKNHPAVFISWKDAIQFCQWLTKRWHNAGCLPKTWQVTLPDEAEWEKAARGGLQIPQTNQTGWNANQGLLSTDVELQLENNKNPQRRYPWGNEINDEFLNFEWNIGSSTTDIYPLGISPYGCQDMAGNVWEWTRSEYAEYPYPKIKSEEWK